MAAVEFPEALFERVHSGNCVLCTGLRFAAAAGMPDWDALFSQMSEKLGDDVTLVKRLIGEGKLLTVAGYLKRKLGAQTCAQMLAEAYGQRDQLPEPHRILSELPFHAALTTGYDVLVEQALTRNGASPKVYTYADAAVLRLSENLDHFVLKAHGDVDHLEELGNRLVLSRLDYRRIINPNHAFRAFVEDLYRTHTLLLVGFHGTDPDFILFLEQLMSSFRDAVTDHYAILSGLTPPEMEELYANYRVRVIPYEEGDDPVAALAETLSCLRDQWRKRGAELPGPEDPRQKIQWLQGQLAAVELRIDQVPAQGLEFSEAQLNAIRNTAASLGDAMQLDAETLCRLGNVSLILEDVAGAIEAYNAALSQASEMFEAHLNLHVALAEAKQLAEAMEHLKQAMKLEPTLLVIPKRYELRTVLGRGSTGSIYHATDTEEGRDVTVKVLRTSYLQEHVSPEQWVKESMVLRELDHPNQAKVYEVIHQYGKCILVTESLSGQSVAKALRESAMTPDRAAGILQEVCAGLQDAHEKGIFHLDLTPSNVFLRDDGSVALMDFRPGRAQRGRHVAIGKGSEGFQAPEILAAVGADARADVYSLGALFYYMLTNRAPIGSFPKLGELNPAARRYEPLVNQALRALPDERPQSVAAFASALAGKSEAVDLPENEEDLLGWLGVLNYQPDNERAIQVLEHLEQTYRETEDWDNLVTLILGRVELEVDPGQRVAMFKELAGIFEREVGDLSKAFAALKEAFRENTSSLEIRRELERLAGATGIWNELLQEYSQLVQNLRDPKVACDWWVRIGQLYSSELGHDDYAIASFNQALVLDSNRVDAILELAELVKRKGDHEEYARLLRRQVDLEDDTARKAELLKDLARSYVKDQGNDQDGISTYRRILELDPHHAVALAALQGLYHKHEMWSELAELLTHQIETTDVAEDLKRYRHALAEVLAQRLNRLDDAIGQYQELVRADADDLDALKGLEALYDRTGRNQDYLTILDRRIESAGSGEEKAALCRRMAAEWEAQPDGHAKAAEYLEMAVSFTGGDAEIYKALVRLYWALKDYPKLAGAYERQIDFTQDANDRAGLFAALGKVYEEHMEDPSRAIDVFSTLLAMDPQSKIALGALSRLYEKTAVWGQAVQMLEQLATKEESVDQQVELFYRIGLIQLEHLNRADEAEVSLTKALELRDDHVDAMLALSRLYQERKDYGKAARILREAGRNTANELERVKRLHQAGVIYQDDIGDPEKGQEVFEELLSLDPEHVPTGNRLALLYEAAEQYDKAEGLLEMLVRKSDNRDRARLIELNTKLGEIALKCGHDDRALTAFRAAYDLDPTSQRALRNLAGLLYRRKEYEEAGKLFQALLVHRRDSLDPGEIVEVFFQLGDIKQQMGERGKALNMYEKALDQDPSNMQVLERAMELYRNKGDLEAVLRCKKSMLKGATEEEARIGLAEEIGDMLVEELNRPNEAVNHYRMVTEVKPDHRRVLNKIMEALLRQNKWDEAIATMGKIEDYETDPQHRSRLHYTAAVIFRDKLKRPTDSAHHFDQALVKDPSNRKAFDSLKKLYVAQKNFKGLAKAYRLMLKRLPQDTPTKEQVALWNELGEICQDHLHDAKGAIAAFEVAAKLDPTDETRQERLAQLYLTAGPDAYDKAILANHRRLLSNPMRIDSYKELRRLYAEIGDYDKAWCVAAVLGWLKKASDEEMALYQKHRNQQPRRVARKLSDDLWSEHLCHPSQTLILNEVFSLAAPLVAPMVVRPAKELSLKSADLLDLENETRAYAKVAEYVGQVLDASISAMYIRGDMDRDHHLRPVLVGASEEMSTNLLVNPKILQNDSLIELTYWFTKALSLLRPEHVILFSAGSLTVLRAVVLAFLKVARPATRLTGDVQQIERLAYVFKTDLPPSKLDLVAARSSELRDASSEAAIESWMEGVNLSTTRAALLLCDDLETAARLVSTEPGGSPAQHGEMVKQRLRELMVFAVSESYFKLREHLGLQIH